MSSAVSENLKKRKVAQLSREEEEEFIKNLLKRRNNQKNAKGSTADDDEESDLDGLPFGGKVYLPRRRRADTWCCIAFQAILVLAVVSLAYYAYYYYEHMHVNVLKAYAHFGFDTAQHELGNRYLYGVGVEKHEEKAMEWFKKASDQGHPHSAYNLAIGHLKGMKTPIDQTEAKRLIQHAANNNVHEAKLTWENICKAGGCDD